MYFFHFGVLKIKRNFLGGLPKANFCKRGGRGGQKTGKNANVICERSHSEISNAASADTQIISVILCK